MVNKKFILSIFFILVSAMPRPAFGDQKIKQPNVSGQFYSADPAQLSQDIDGFFAKADIVPVVKHVEILVAPHAGYFYSGSVAAYSFKAVSQSKYKTVVILAPSHFFGFDGISVWDEGAFATPLGQVEVDSAFTKKLAAANPKFYFEPKAFEKEHALEVEIPFLQKTFKDFKIVPVVMGMASFPLLNDFAAALKDIIGNRGDVLIVVSTDLSHYHEDGVARKMDAVGLSFVKELDAQKVFAGNYQRSIEMCGFVPLTAAILYAKLKGINHVDILHYGNSGDASGDRRSVVGYSSVIMYRDGIAPPGGDSSKLNKNQKKKLLEIARSTIDQFVKTKKAPSVIETDPRLL